MAVRTERTRRYWAKAIKFVAERRKSFSRGCTGVLCVAAGHMEKQALVIIRKAYVTVMPAPRER